MTAVEPSAAGAGSPHGDADALILRLAARQHGVVAREQLLRAGVSEHRIAHRVRKGWLHTLHRGVYRVGPGGAPYEREMAAVLACGERAVVSHLTSAIVWQFFPARDAIATVEISVDRGCRRPRAGVRVHRVRALPADEQTRHQGLPITTPARALLDIAGEVGQYELERALARADRQQIATRDEIERLLARYPRRRGTLRLRILLGAKEGAALTRSEAEERFLRLIRKARLRTPKTNVVVRGFEVDCLWRSERLVVEIDGFAYHSSRKSFESDRRRDGVLTAAGFRVIRVTWNQIANEPEALVACVAQAIAVSGSRR